MNLLNFKSYSFLLFLSASLLCYYAVPKRHQWKALMGANIAFYAASGPLNFIFILLTSVSTFLGAAFSDRLNVRAQQRKASGGFSKEELKEQKARDLGKKRAVLAAVIVVNFGTLFLLKYWNALAAFLGEKLAADLSFLHFGGNGGLLLPLGISFYTFQSFAYFMDVYNGKYRGEKSFPRYFLFVSFFPQLIMGPINRYDKLGSQLKEEHAFDFENMKKGALLILFGAMKKYCIADLLSGRISAVLDHSYTNLPGALIGGAIVMFSIYQYADFSGGIDMVLGFARLFGIRMQPNFRQPYFAASLADFWRRWHISLGLWMKDYVFYPLVFTKRMQRLAKFCQNRMGKHFARTVPAGIANIAVFLIVGIWHGPELHFVLWGLFNGLVIALSDMMRPASDRLSAFFHTERAPRLFRIFQAARTFLVVNIGAYFDRIADVRLSFLYLKRTFLDFGPLSVLKSRSYLKSIFGSFRNVESELVLICTAGMIVFATSLLREKKDSIYPAIQSKNIAVRWAAYYVPMLLILLAQSYAPGTPLFMYAQY